MLQPAPSLFINILLFNTSLLLLTLMQQRDEYNLSALLYQLWEIPNLPPPQEQQTAFAMPATISYDGSAQVVKLPSRMRIKKSNCSGMCSNSQLHIVCVQHLHISTMLSCK